MAMALRVVRCQSKRHLSISINRSIYIARDLIKPAAATFVTPTYHYHHLPSSFRPGHDICNRFGGAHSRSFSSSSSSNNKIHEDNTNKNPSNEGKSDHTSQNNQPVLLYEGPFASLTLRLKRISLMSAAIGLVGLPALSLFYGAGSVPATGQLAIIATAGVTAVGSTALLGYCFSPYVHTMECLSGDYYANETDETNGDDATTVDGKNNQNLVRVITRDILAREVETVFNPATDVSPPPNNNSRPFCNFMVMGDKPMYVHADLIHDYKLKVQLLGEEEVPQQQEAAKNKQKLDDDEFL